MCYALAGNASGPALNPAEAGNIIDRKRNFIAQNLPSPPFHCLSMTEIFLKRVIHPSNYWTEHNSHWKKYSRTSLARLLMTRLSRLVVELVIESLGKSPIAADLEFLRMDFFFILKVVFCVYSLDSPLWGDSKENTERIFKWRKQKYIPIMSPDLALWLTLISSNYPCLEHIYMVPKVFEPLKFYCN